ncbi:hypothetical protein MRB53_011897 [Persea americana]|uniref:Uncharacterized protein n=1 Tax=Persea americana TaxID=3435 RepID=A0ACC2LW53_PERAE|nr:hypothetical protein MRB53_011897 [Persea americana]
MFPLPHAFISLNSIPGSRGQPCGPLTANGAMGFNRIVSFTTACRYSSFPKSSTLTISPYAGCSWLYCGLLLSLHGASAV